MLDFVYILVFSIFCCNHVVTIDLNGGTGDTTYSSKGIISAEELPEPTKENYHFVEWQTTEGDKIGEIFTSCDVQAVYNPNVYTVRFKDGDDVVSSTNFAYGTGLELLQTTVTDNKNHPYETFDGWIDYETGEKITRISKTENKNKILVASWKPNTYSITATMADSEEEVFGGEYTYGETQELANDISIGSLLQFDGFYADSDYSQKVTAITSENLPELLAEDGKIHLYAKFETAVSKSQQSSQNSSTNGTSYVSTSTSSSASGYNVNTGVTIPRMGYHVDNIVVDGSQSDIDAENTGVLTYHYIQNWIKPDGSYATWDEVFDAEEATGKISSSEQQEALESQGWQYLVNDVSYWCDHAYQGLSGLGDKLVAGDICYINGTAYTYSGVCDSDLYNFPNMPSNTRLIVQTCRSSGGNYLCYFY